MPTNLKFVPDTVTRCRGSLLGLAAGDALGTTLEFKPPGTFQPLDDMVGGGPFGLEPGQWTADTSMALCLGESLLARGGFDARDQMKRYCRWRDEGYLSSTGTCFDIGVTVSGALARTAAPARRNSGDGGEIVDGERLIVGQAHRLPRFGMLLVSCTPPLFLLVPNLAP